ncbi:hypothetical protein C8D97_102161 [Pleionea mediterranea]|uniref:DUF1318 domain-containing protein n=2 Tax=Pleionea mediterranea TaxID=523701 RepID=A0A316FZF5_9GAMM|nr:hypothetical protein C8D97_102161 [Pleionea mediterranea]
MNRLMYLSQKNNLTRSVRRFISFTVALLTLTMASAWAANLDSAKAEGLIGEKSNGYLGLVVNNAPSDVRRLVDDVNAKRKQKYQEVANSRNIDLSKVELIAGKKAIEKTQSGHYIEVNGRWVKK